MSTKNRTRIALPIAALSLVACDPLARHATGYQDPRVEPGVMVAQPPGLTESEDPATPGPGDVVGGAVITDVLPLCPGSDDTQPGMTGRSLAVDPRDKNVIYVGVEGRGYFRSRDGGASWSRVITGMKAHYVDTTHQLCFDRFTTTAVDPRDGNHLCVAVRGRAGTTDAPLLAPDGIYCSKDGGTRWSHRTPAGMNTAVNALAIDPDTASQLYAGLSGAAASDGTYPQKTSVLATSYDDGFNWYELDVGSPLAPGMETSDLLLVPSWPRRLYAAVPVVGSPTPLHAFDGPQLGLLSSTDGGLTWSRLDNGMGERNADRAITRVAAAPFNPDHLLVANGNVAPSTGPFFYASSDGGGTFRSPSSPANLALDTFAFDPSDGSGRHALGFSGASDHLWETMDGGDTWIDLGAILPGDAANRPVRLTHLVWSPDANVLYASGSHASVYKSADGGRTWNKVLTEDMLDVVVK